MLRLSQTQRLLQTAAQRIRATVPAVELLRTGAFRPAASCTKQTLNVIPSRAFYHTSGLRQDIAAAGNSSPSSSTDANNSTKSEKKKKKDDSNIFLDNLGTIFLTAIGLLVASLVRSFYGSSRKNALRDRLEELAVLDPLEIDELRRVNPTLNVSVFRALLQQIWKKYPSGQLTYEEFMETIREALLTEHHIPTVEFGHMLDRVALHTLKMKGDMSTDPQSATLWMVILSLALNAPTPDRIQVLYETLQQEASALGESSVVTVSKVYELVGFLQATNQLVIDTQLIETKGQEYPIQHYHRASPKEMIEWNGTDSEPMDVDALAAVLRSKAVCAWGECYHRKKFN